MLRVENKARSGEAFRYLVAIASVLLALSVSFGFGLLVEQRVFLPFLAAVAFASWLGGLGPGLVATFLSFAFMIYFLVPPQLSINLADPAEGLRLGLFLLVAILINVLSYTRYRAEMAEREGRARLQVTLASIGDAVIATDTNGRLTFMNPVAEGLTGWQQADAMGKDLIEVFRIINKQTRAPVENPVARVLRTGAVVGLANHTLLIARDGMEYPIDDSGAPIRNENGEPLGVVLVFRDVSERTGVEAERSDALLRERAARAEAEAERRRMAFLAEASAVLGSSLEYEATLASVARLAVPDIADWCGVYLLADDGSIQLLSAAHVDPAKVELARELHRRYPPDPDTPGGLGYVIRSGKPELFPLVTDEMVAAFAADEQHLAMLRAIGFSSYVIAPLNVRGRTLGALVFVSAESERRYTAEDAALAEHLARRSALAIDNASLFREAQAAIRARDQFMSVASHELKTPLSVLLGYTQLVQRRTERNGTLSERDREALNVVVQQAARLDRMVMTMLDLSRIEAGQLSIERKPVDLTALARRLVAEVEPTLVRHTLQSRLAEEPLIVQGDELRLEQAIQNLLQNAVKYSPMGGAIDFSLERRNGNAFITVADQGMGIPEVALPRLFERFYRAPNVDPAYISGMGIGLYIVREIAQLHGGDVSVASTVGEGSTFTIRIPLSVQIGSEQLAGAEGVAAPSQPAS